MNEFVLIIEPVKYSQIVVLELPTNENDEYLDSRYVNSQVQLMGENLNRSWGLYSNRKCRIRKANLTADSIEQLDCLVQKYKNTCWVIIEQLLKR
jgi:hypothetical protein